MSEITDNMAGYLNELDNYMKRLQDNRLSRRDRKLFLQMSNEYYDIFRGAVSGNEASVPAALLTAIEEFNDSIIDEDGRRTNQEQIQDIRSRIVEYAGAYMDNVRRNELISDVFRGDAEIIRLQNEKVLRLQELVDLDMKLSRSGELSQNITMILEAQHMEVTEGRVREIMEWEQQRTEEQIESSAVLETSSVKEKHTESDNRDIGQEAAATALAPEQIGIAEKDTYRAYAYMRGTGSDQRPKPIYGSQPAELIETFRRWNQARTKAMQLQTCYIQRLDPDTNKFESAVKYDIESGKDITPIYLNLPHMGKDAFKQLVAKIKADGAKYNAAQKAFYITRQDDLNKFAEYLPLPAQNAGKAQDKAKQRQNTVSYTIESGQEYYDNRVQVTIEELKPFNVYGDDYDVHFPSMSAEDTRELLEKFVLPDFQNQKPEGKLPAEMEYHGRKYDAAQYAVLRMAERQHFTPEQMALLEQPDMSAAEMSEIRFSIRDGLTPEQIRTVMSANLDIWQMDICRIGLQHGLHADEIAPVIDASGYTPDQWGERRNQIQKLVHAKDREAKRNGLMGKLSEKKEKVETSDHKSEERTAEKAEER